MQTPTLKIGTRNSILALAQAHEVRTRLMKVHNLPASAFDIVPMSTAGDRLFDRSLAEIGGKGLFTEEIETALKEGRIDIAVHSAKDMPAVLPGNLHLSVFLKREDPRDVFIGKTAKHVRDLPHGATIGSSSIRRQALIRKSRPDLNIVLFRGNIQSRLAKFQQGVVDGTFLALAGLKRLGLQDMTTEIMEPEHFLPAPGQGAIVIESRVGDSDIDMQIRHLADTDTHYEMACERAFMATLDGSCRTPLGGLARARNNEICFSGMIITPDGTVFHAVKLLGSVHDAAEIGRHAAEKLKKDAGHAFFEGWF